MKFPIRVLHVVTIMDAGGIETMLMNLYRNIDRDKVQFDFLVHREKEGFFDAEILSLGGKIYRMMPLAVHKVFSYCNQLNKFFLEHKEYKIVHSHISINSYFVLRKAKNNNIPYRIAHSHESHQSIWEFRLPRIPIIWFLKKLINKPLTHRFACAVEAGKWLFGENQDFAVINNAINTASFLYDKDKAAHFKSELGVDDSLVIGHVGNFTAVKNYTFILDVFQAILELEPRSVLLLVGDNTRNNNVIERVKNMGIDKNVVFTGLRSDVFNMYQAMDIFLFPSISEGLPVTLVEAQASGLKIFASDSITKEVNLTNEIDFLSLNESAEYWADRILHSIPYDRKDNYDVIKLKSYDINENARYLQSFYIKLLQSLLK